MNSSGTPSASYRYSEKLVDILTMNLPSASSDSTTITSMGYPLSPSYFMALDRLSRLIGTIDLVSLWIVLLIGSLLTDT